MFWWCCADFSNLAGIFRSSNKADVETGHEQRRQNAGTKWHEERHHQAELESQFRSIFTYDNGTEQHQQQHTFGGTSSALPIFASDVHQKLPLSDRLLNAFCTVLSSTFLFLTFPISLPFSLKFIGSSERLVIMRLGRPKGVYGPGGTALILPWIDKATKVDLSVFSIELPPIRSLTTDQGMVELTVTVFSQVTDPLVAYCTVQNVKETLHSLAYATLCRRICKLLLCDLTNSNIVERVLLSKCQDEMNAFVQPRGVCVERLALTQLTVLKQADSGSAAVSVLHTLARSQFGQQLFDQLGTAFLSKGQPQQQHQQSQPNCSSFASSHHPSSLITPELIIADRTNGDEHNQHDDDEEHDHTAVAAAHHQHQSFPFDAMSTISEETSTIDTDGINGGGSEQFHHHQLSSVPSSSSSSSTLDHQPPLLFDDADLVALLVRIRGALCPSLVHRVGRLFRVRLLLFTSSPLPGATAGPSSGCNTTSPTAAAEFDIDLRTGNGWCGWTRQRSGPPKCDVLFTLQKCTLLALLDGTVSPLCAYLEGRVQIDGPVQEAALLKHLADALHEVAAAQAQTSTAATSSSSSASIKTEII